MAQREDSKFTPSSAEAAIKKYVKISGKVITVNKNGMGLKALSALDYLTNECGAIVKFERESQSNWIPLDSRGKIIGK